MTQSVPPSMRHVGSLVDVDGMRSGVDARLEVILLEQAKLLSSLSPDAELLIDAWRQLLIGGKRLRAAFAYWGYRAINQDATLDPNIQKNLFRVGASLELFQAAALFHDDIMDRSDTRRGNETAHKTFERTHNESGFVGDAAQYGMSTGILLGDLSLVAAENEFRQASYAFPESARLRSHAIFDLMRTTVTVGQFLDVHAQVAPWSGDFIGAKKRAMDIIKTKTSSYSVTHPLLAGAALAGASEEQLAALERFAMPIGIAYQLFDDLLGAFGNPETTGKPAGDDLKEGKRTVLVIEALKRLSAPERAILQESLGRQDLTESEVAHLLSLITKSGAVEATQDLVAELSQEGLKHLADPSLNPVGVDMLQKIAAYALKRDY